MAGGGIKGLANAPAFHLLNDAGVLEDIENCIGSSVGGLNSAALALGNNPDEMEQLLRSGGDGLLDLFSSSPVFARATRAAGRVIKHLVNEQSAAKGYALYEKAQSSVASKLGHPHATFSDLSKKVGQPSASGGRFRNLELTVTVSDPRGSYQIVCSSQTTPNMPIALAMRMTAGLPPVFPMVKITSAELKKYTEGATEPLVKYDRGKPFPPYDAQVFNALQPEKKQSYIDSINNDILSKKLINCSDGGVVDNLPIYLAMNKPGGSAENTMGFFFEQPSEKRLRMQNQHMYQEDIQITKEQEQHFFKKTVPNNFIRKLYFNYVSKPRRPPSHQLALLQKKNLLCFDTDNISSADFELETDKHMTHVEKKAYLLRAGYHATEEYLSTKLSAHAFSGKKSFEDLYPNTPEPPLCIEDQIEMAKNQVNTWEKVFSNLSTEVKAPKGYKNELKNFHFFIRQAQKYQKHNMEHDAQIQVKLNSIQDFTEKNITEIVNAKKDCRIALEAAVGALSESQKINYMLASRFKPYKKNLVKNNPELANKITEIIELKQNSMLLDSLLSTTRDKSVSFQVEHQRSNLDKVGTEFSHTLSRLLSNQLAPSFKDRVPPDRPNLNAPKLHFSYESKLRKKEQVLDAVLNTQGLDFEALIVEANQHRNIVKIDIPANKDSHAEVLLSFKGKQSSELPITVRVIELENTSAHFSMNHFSENAYKNPEIQKVVQSICEMAIFSAKPNAKIAIPSTLSEGNKKMILDSLDKALKKAMALKPPKFEKGSEPIIADQLESKNKKSVTKKSG